MPHPALSPNRTAVITGGASGIGLAMADRLASAGMNVCVADFDEAALGQAAESLGKVAERGADAIMSNRSRSYGKPCSAASVRSPC
jgi:NAD(P)-dependent dehydrogenase (short-subunit alcohol dehydrogenase family)